MPIKIPDGLPAAGTLRSENIFVMTESRAAHQDIRPLSVLILNLMPKKIETETQLMRKLSNTPLQVSIDLLRIDDHVSKNTPKAHIDTFYESFDDCFGTGGNDGIFGTGMSASRFFADNEGWTTEAPYGALQCAFFGTATRNGAAITPALTLESGKAYTLTFKAAPYDGGGTTLAVAVTSGNALVSDDAAAGSTPATSVNVEMESGKWTDYSLTLTGNGDQKLRFRGATGPVKRFFLDEVLLTEKVSTGIMAVPSVSQDTADGAAYNLSGQRVGKDWRGIRIVGGKKIVK